MTLSSIDWPMILAGLGLFLFGIEYMGDGLKGFSGDKLKKIIDKYTSSPLKGILVGAGVTCLIQSSSGTTALTIGLIRSGLMTLNQGVGIIMGANIGTTITAFIIGLKISQYAVYFIIIGAFLLMFSSNKKNKYLGQIFFGFGCLFYGLELMGSNLSMISQVPEFSQAVQFLANNPLLALLGGIVMTCVIQSSSAVIAIVQQMYGIGAISLGVALPFLFGSNIGTTITAILASFGGSTPAKRAALFHVMFNVFGTIIFMIVLTPFNHLIVYINTLVSLSPEMQLAVAHGIFNIITTIVMYPFINKMVTLIKVIIKSKNKEIEMDLSELDEHVVSLFPSNALGIAKSKTIQMGTITIEALENVKVYLDNKNNSAKDYVYEMENAINLLDTKITEYLVLISHETLNDHDSNSYFANMKTTKDFERIGDLAVNIVTYFEHIYDAKETLNQEAKEDIMTMLDMVIEMLNKAIIAFDTHDVDAIDFVDSRESDLDYFNRKAKSRHIKRVTQNIDNSPIINSYYVDIISNLERMGDHCQNIAESYMIDEESLTHKAVGSSAF